MLFEDYFPAALTDIESSTDHSKKLEASSSAKREIVGKFQTILFHKFKDIDLREAKYDPYKLMFYIPASLMRKYSLEEGFYHLKIDLGFQNIITKQSFNNNSENEFLVKLKPLQINWSENDKEYIILSEILEYNLKIRESVSVIISNPALELNDKKLELMLQDKFHLAIPLATKLLLKPNHSYFSKFITPELVHNLLHDLEFRIIHPLENIILNFFHRLNNDFTSKLPQNLQGQFIKLMSLKKTMNSSWFYFSLSVIEIHSGKQDSTEINEHSFYLLNPSILQVTIENPPNNQFLPLKRLPLQINLPDKFIEQLSQINFFNSRIQALVNTISVPLRQDIIDKKNHISIIMSYPKGLKISLWIQRIANQIGYNYIEKKVKKLFTTKQIEKNIFKAIAQRPTIILFRTISHIQTLLSSQAALSKSNSVSNYFEHLHQIISDMDSKAPDCLPVVYIFAESKKEKIDDIISQTPNSFEYILHLSPMSDQDHSDVVTFLLSYLDMNLDDIPGLINATKGIGWKKIINFLQENSRSDTKTLITKFEKLRKAESDITALNIPNVTWDDIGGLIEAKNEIIDTIMIPQWYPELFKGSIKPRTGILFFGPPGTGKTMLAKAVATECKMNFLSVKGPELLNMYVGESEKNVRDIFNKARSNLPCIIFFDELDALVPNRGKGSDSNSVMDRIVAQFMTEVDGLGKESGLFVIGATNRPDLLDPSLLRPGRFDKMVYLGINEDKESRLKVLQAQTRKFNLESDVDLEALEKKIPKNFSGADFYALTSAAILRSVKRKIREVDEQFEQYKKKNVESITFEEWAEEQSKDKIVIKVNQNDFLEVLDDIKPSVSPEELEKYRELREKYSLHKA